MRQWHTYTHPSTTPSTNALIQQMVDKCRRYRDRLQWNGVCMVIIEDLTGETRKSACSHEDGRCSEAVWFPHPEGVET